MTWHHELIDKSPRRDNAIVCELIKQLGGSDSFKNPKAAYTAKSIVDILTPWKTTESISTYVLTYTLGPFEKPPLDEQKQVYLLVMKALSPRYKEQGSTPEKKLYTTDIKGLTITSETTHEKYPGVTSHVIKLHREADMPKE